MKLTQLTIKQDPTGVKAAYFQSCTGRRGFSIQTNGNLPQLHRQPHGTIIPAHAGDTHLWTEFLDFVRDYGTDYQKSFFNFGGM